MEGFLGGGYAEFYGPGDFLVWTFYLIFFGEGLTPVYTV